MEKDPFELYPLHNNHINVQDILNKVREISKQHLNSIVAVPQQLGNFSRNLIPCCNPPHCSCDILNRDFHLLISHRAKNRQQQLVSDNDGNDDERTNSFLMSLENKVNNFFWSEG